MVDKQLDYLQRRLFAEPHLATLIYQGRNLDYYLSAEGVAEIWHAARSKSLDPVALRHGVERLRLSNFEGEVVWDANLAKTMICRDDPIIKRLESNFPSIRTEVAHVLSQQTLFPDSDALTNTTGSWMYLPFFAEPGGGG